MNSTDTAVPVPVSRIRAGEVGAMLVCVAYFFCVLTAYYVMRPVREQLLAAVGSTQLPWFYAATFVATLALAPVFGALVARYPRRIVMPVVNGFFIVCLLAFIPLFTHEGLLSPRVLGTAFFVWVSVFNLFVVSVFWVFMSDIWSEDQARRLFPIIAIGGTLGAVVGPRLTVLLVDIIGVAPLLAVSATLLAVGLGCAVWLDGWAREHGARHARTRLGVAVGGGMLDGLKQIFASPFMRSMAVLLLLADGIGTVNYALVADYAGSTFTEAVDRTRFYGRVDGWANLLAIGLQLLVTHWLLPRKGPGFLIAIWATVSIAALSLVIFSDDPHAPLVAGFPAVVLALIVSRGLAYGMAEPARHSLFTRIPRDERYKGQNAVDTAVWRFGDMCIAIGMNALRGMGLATAGFAAISATAALMAAAIGVRLARRHTGAAASGPAHS